MANGATVGSSVLKRAKEKGMDGRNKITGSEDIPEERREEERIQAKTERKGGIGTPNLLSRLLYNVCIDLVRTLLHAKGLCWVVFGSAVEVGCPIRLEELW